jgi:hypothetical protein
MAEDSEFKYDVAFSFVQEDEQLANEIEHLLADRLTTFIYSSRQKELAGRDGEQRFAEVFSKEARIVVILYRPQWGSTPFTRIEETAIRNRAFSDGYDFVVLIPTDSPPTKPDWFPRFHLYVGMKRWGVQGAATVIEERVSALGGTVREETVSDRAARLARAKAFAAQRGQFLNSSEGVNAAKEEGNYLVSALETLSKDLSSKYGIDIATRFKSENSIDISGGKYCLSVDWAWPYSNTLDGSRLSIRVWDGPTPRPGRVFFKEPSVLDELTFAFDRDSAGNNVWNGGTPRVTHSSQKLAETVVKAFLDRLDGDITK